ncbi:MAG: hypothetical protein AB1713_01165 [Pseudomonadota bacterium]
MAESRLVPCNLMAWPKIRNLLPEQKLIVYHLWATCQSAVGCQLLDFGAFQGALSLTQEALRDTIGELEKRGLVDVDEETGEVAIVDWARWHKFNTPSRRRLAEDAIKRIQSPRLRQIVEKTMTCDLREGEGEGKVREVNINTHPAPVARVTPPAESGGPTAEPWGGCVEILMKKGVGRGRLAAARRRLAAIRTQEGGALTEADWRDLVEAMSKADDPPAWLTKVASSGWRQGRLADLAHPGETISQVKARLAGGHHPQPRASENKSKEDLRRSDLRQLEEKLRAQLGALENIERNMSTVSAKARLRLEEDADKIRQQAVITESLVRELRRDLGLPPPLTTS